MLRNVASKMISSAEKWIQNDIKRIKKVEMVEFGAKLSSRSF